MSSDGYAARPAQDHPLGVGGRLLHEWVVPEATDRTPVDEHFLARGGRHDRVALRRVRAVRVGHARPAPAVSRWRRRLFDTMTT